MQVYTTVCPPVQLHVELYIIQYSATTHTGDVSGGATTLLEVHERLAREKMAGREGQNTDELDSSFRLLLLLNSLDLSLLHSSVQQLGKSVKLL